MLCSKKNKTWIVWTLISLQECKHCLLKIAIKVSVVPTPCNIRVYLASTIAHYAEVRDSQSHFRVIIHVHISYDKYSTHGHEINRILPVWDVGVILPDIWLPSLYDVIWPQRNIFIISVPQHVHPKHDNNIIVFCCPFIMQLEIVSNHKHLLSEALYQKYLPHHSEW